MAALGLWLSRDYPIGTALRMGTGYVPRLLCWLLLGLGVIVLVQGLREAQDARPLSADDISSADGLDPGSLQRVIAARATEGPAILPAAEPSLPSQPPTGQPSAAGVRP